MCPPKMDSVVLLPRWEQETPLFCAASGCNDDKYMWASRLNESQKKSVRSRHKRLVDTFGVPRSLYFCRQHYAISRKCNKIADLSYGFSRLLLRILDVMAIVRSNMWYACFLCQRFSIRDGDESLSGVESDSSSASEGEVSYFGGHQSAGTSMLIRVFHLESMVLRTQLGSLLSRLANPYRESAAPRYA